MESVIVVKTFPACGFAMFADKVLLLVLKMQQVCAVVHIKRDKWDKTLHCIKGISLCDAGCHCHHSGMKAQL